MKKLIFLYFAILSYASQAQQKDTVHQKSVTAYFILGKYLNEPGIKDKEIKMMIVDFPALSISPPHRHPCPTFGYVLEGKIESVFEGKSYLYKKGDSFYETTNGLHSKTRNPDDANPAKLLVFYIIDPNKKTSVPEHQSIK